MGTFKNDKTKDGWRLVSNFFSASALYVDMAPYKGILRRCLEQADPAIKTITLFLGQGHAEYLFDHRNEIPEECREFAWYFVATVWQDREGERKVVRLSFDVGAGEWRLEFVTYYMESDTHISSGDSYEPRNTRWSREVMSSDPDIGSLEDSPLLRNGIQELYRDLLHKPFKKK